MIKYKYISQVNKPPLLLEKIPIMELFAACIGFGVIIFVLAIIQMVIPIPDMVIFITAIAGFVVFVVILFKSASKPHPSYLFSYISFRFLQPNRVVIRKIKQEFFTRKRQTL